MATDEPLSLDEARRLAALAVERIDLPEPEDADAWRAIRQLQARGGRAALLCARELASSAVAKDRDVAAAILGQLGVRPLNAEQGENFANERFSALSAMIACEADARVLRAILIAFGHLDDVRVFPLAIALRRHASPRVRYGVVHAISGYDDRGAIDALIELSADEDVLVRDWATFALGAQTDADTEPLREALFARIKDSEDDIVHEAIFGLARRGDVRVVPRIVDALDALHLSLPLFEAISSLGLSEFCVPLRAIPADALVFLVNDGRQRIDLEGHRREALASCRCCDDELGAAEVQKDITAFEEGVDAFERGRSREDCPYPANDDRRALWIAGWDQAKRGDELFVDGLP